MTEEKLRKANSVLTKLYNARLHAQDVEEIVRTCENYNFSLCYTTKDDTEEHFLKLDKESAIAVLEVFKASANTTLKKLQVEFDTL